MSHSSDGTGPGLPYRVLAELGAAGSERPGTTPLIMHHSLVPSSSDRRLLGGLMTRKSTSSSRPQMPPVPEPRFPKAASLTHKRMGLPTFPGYCLR